MAAPFSAAAAGPVTSGSRPPTTRQAPASAKRACSRRLFSAWPERCPAKRPRIGSPASARSPTRSSSLWRTNSSGQRSPPGFSTSGPSTTTAFAREPPCARPAARRRATSSARVKVRAVASVSRTARGERRSASDCRPIAVFGKSISSAASQPFSGFGRSSAQAPLASSTRTGRSTSTMPRGRPLATLPAQSSRKMKGAAEPSRIGTSGPSSSTTASSMPQATKAAIRCSIVPTRASGTSAEPSAVHSRVSTTRSKRAGISTPPRSARRKRMPLPAAAGCRVRRTRRPVCRPTPTQPMEVLSVLRRASAAACPAPTIRKPSMRTPVLRAADAGPGSTPGPTDPAPSRSGGPIGPPSRDGRAARIPPEARRPRESSHRFPWGAIQALFRYITL